MADVVIAASAVTRVHTRGDDEVRALGGVDFHVERGEMVAVMGRSGSGKTTLLNCVSGLDRPTTGSITVLGTDLAALGSNAIVDWRRTNVGFVFQAHALVGHLSAFENVELALRIRGVERSRRTDLAHDALNAVGLAEWSDHRPAEMSGGQQQRVAVARAIADPAPLLIADEPTAELDVETARAVMRHLRSVVDRDGVTAVLATHDPDVAELADRVVRLADGLIVDAPDQDHVT